MNKKIIYALVMISAFTQAAQAEVFRFDAKSPKLINRQISGPSTFSIENFAGKVLFYERAAPGVGARSKTTGQEIL